MKKLDPRTLDRLAAVICDLDGPNERPGWQLERLLRHSGWSDPPQYDGSYRVPWLAQALHDRADQVEDIERVLRRACDPIEYDGSKAIAEDIRAAINEVFDPERLTITLIGGRPVLAELSDGPGAPIVLGMPDDLRNRLIDLTGDAVMAAVLVDRAEQSRLAQGAGAHLLAVIGIGSFVEGVLLSVLLHRDPHVDIRDERGRRKDADFAGLEALLFTALRDKHIELDVRQFLAPVRSFRNYIHPRRQAAEDFSPNYDTVVMSWGPAHAVLNDLEQSKPA